MKKILPIIWIFFLIIGAGKAFAVIQIGTPETRESVGDDVADYYHYLSDGAEIKKVERALQDIAPCLLIVAAQKTHKGNDRKGIRTVKKGEIIIRTPFDDLSDLPDSIQRQLTKSINNAKKQFKECYQQNRAGCNLLWVLSKSEKVTTIWEARIEEDKGDSGGNKHFGGNIGWNQGRTRGGRSTTGRTRRPQSIGLAHELAHAYHWAKESRGETREEEEFKACRAENQIRREMVRRSEGEKKAMLKPRTTYNFDYGERDIPDRDGIDIALDEIIKIEETDLDEGAEETGSEDRTGTRESRGPVIRETGQVIPGFTEGENLEVCVGKTKTGKFNKQVEVTVLSSSDKAIVDVELGDDNSTLLITGKKIGKAEVFVAGDIIKYQAGTNVPLAIYQPFSIKIQVDVKGCPPQPPGGLSVDTDRGR